MSNILGIILMAASIWTFFGFVDNHYQTVKSLKAEEAEYSAALLKANEIDVVRRQLVSKYATFSQSELSQLEKMLPDSVDNVRLIIDINNIASRYGMFIRDIQIEHQSDSSAGSGSQNFSPNSGVSSPTGAPKYDSILFNFSIAGSYENFKNFMNDIERSLRIVDVVSVDFKATKENFNTYQVSTRTYWLKK